MSISIFLISILLIGCSSSSNLTKKSSLVFEKTMRNSIIKVSKTENYTILCVITTNKIEEDVEYELSYFKRLFMRLYNLKEITNMEGIEKKKNFHKGYLLVFCE